MIILPWWRDLNHRILVKTVVFAALLAILWWNQHSGFQARQRETCDAVNEERAALVTYIDQQLDRGAKSLPTIDYYRKHPVELGKALSNLAQQREDTHAAFAPVDC